MKYKVTFPPQCTIPQFHKLKDAYLGPHLCYIAFQNLNLLVNLIFFANTRFHIPHRLELSFSFQFSVCSKSSQLSFIVFQITFAFMTGE